MARKPHVHRWLLSEAGAASPGRCRCGAKREFNGGFDLHDYHGGLPGWYEQRRWVYRQEKNKAEEESYD